MKTGGLLPQRWRTEEQATRHAAAILGVLETRPVATSEDGIAIFTMIGTADVLQYLVAVKSFRQHLGRGRIVIMDDGSLTAPDRAILAHHCGDPAILSVAAVDRGAFPATRDWARLLAVLDRRQREYWIMLGSDTVTAGPLPEIEAALARNRSFILSAPDQDEEARSIAAALSANPGWRNAAGDPALAGFSAMGSGRNLAAAFRAALERDGADLSSPRCVEIAAAFHIANDAGSELLDPRRYVTGRAGADGETAAFQRFAQPGRHDDGTYEAASLAAIDRLGPSPR